MATLTEELFTVRSITVDGEFVAESPAMGMLDGYATFDDTVENSGEGMVIQLIAEDGRVATETIIGG